MTDKTQNPRPENASLMGGDNLLYLESLEQRYQQNPSALDEKWRHFFEGFAKDAPTRGHRPSWARDDWPAPLPINQDYDTAPAPSNGEAESADFADKIQTQAERLGVGISESDLRQAVLDSVRAVMLIRAYRIRAHLIANTDPLKGAYRQEVPPDLDPKHFGFREGDMERPIFIDNVLGLEIAPMRKILEILRKTYCGTFALQYMHISDTDQALWLRQRIEGYGKEIAFTRKGQRAILQKLVEAEGFEKFLHLKYTGTKRFGLDGGESLIPALEQIIKRGGQLGVSDLVIGMPHRGRLNILANVMKKPLQAIFNEFQGGSSKPTDTEGMGDVKYHLGTSADVEFDGNKVHLSLTANPSHLEAVNPVVLGKVRAKQSQINDSARQKVVPVLLHGDAAFAGQGVVAECFGLSGLKGHRTGGTIHIVVNNQIGFTTAPHFSRSSPYPTDIAMMVGAPIFHVNGDDPEAVVHAARIAVEYRQKFNNDVVIDMICYRRFGHNEGDEPTFTNPLMYNHIKNHKTTLSLYGERLIGEGLIDAKDFDAAKKDYQASLTEAFDKADAYKPNRADWLDGRWAHLGRLDKDYQRGKTSISEETLGKITKALTTIPDDVNVHRKLSRIIDARQKMFEEGKNFDWATGEALAFGALLLEKFPVRLSGQDSVRGTFSQRHSAFIDQKTEDRYFPLNHIEEGQAQFEGIDSMLSEYAVLGFEYGYSLTDPDTLVLWEAQFGDFANGAQIIIDQFISSGESKWLRMSGLVMLLPHGFEGQGPEHSSARLERFLQMSDQKNWIVANCTTPANYFHLLRRQMHRTYRKPLIVMSPKSLLRHRLATSSKEDFTAPDASYHRLLRDDDDRGLGKKNLVADEKIRRVVLCSGKVYYDLYEARNLQKIDDIYLLRVEQYHPFPYISLTEALSRFRQAEIVWCQEEPENQGAWSYIDPHIEKTLRAIGARVLRPAYAGRQASSSPATGLMAEHKEEQTALIERALSKEGITR